MKKSIIFLGLLLMILSPELVFAKKDCSKTKTMAELKQCDPAQYEETQRIINNAQAALYNADKTIQESNQVLEEHTQTLRNVNQDLQKINQDLKNKNY